MMKSFFKKLAFVMALAMVVTLAAPAGSAFAAESGIAVQNTTEVVKSYVIEGLEGTKDFCFLGAPKDWKTQGWTWASSNEDVATVNRAGLVEVLGYGETVISITVGDSYKEEMTLTVKAAEEEMTPVQKTHKMVEVTFTEEHNFDVTGTEGENTVKLYRVFSTEEMAKMSNTNGFVFDEEGNGYQAHYIMSAAKGASANVWNLTGYNNFVDGALYAVVYGPNETSSTIDGIMAKFVAHIGKVDYITLHKDHDATVENDVEPGIAATLSAKLWNQHQVELTGYFNDADETDYEIVGDETDLDVSLIDNEVTFGEEGKILVQGSYTYYDEDLEEDVTKTATIEVKGSTYNTYRIENIYKWTLTDGSKPDFATAKLNNKIIAGDSGQLFVVVVDNRGNYYSNYNIGEVDGKKVGYIGGDEDTAFEQYGYELVFDSLDPDSILVDPVGAVETYKQTKSFAVVSYRRSDDETAKLHEIGVMGIEVTEPRRLDNVKYSSESFNILRETESEDFGENGYYDDDSTFKTKDKLTRTMYTQYKDVKWDEKSEDYDPDILNFTVTTTKAEFEGVAERLAEALQWGDEFQISYDNIFAETEDEDGKPAATSVTFKVKESATGDSTTIKVKLNMPKYTDEGNVFVDSTRAIMEADNAELYINTTYSAKLFQVSKANQKIGYFRIGTAEAAEEDGRSYYVANTLTSGFVVENGKPVEFVSDLTVSTASGSSASSSALASGTALKENDYILVVTDPSGKIFPTVNNGGNGKSFKEGSKLGIKASADGKAYELILAAKTDSGEMEYAATGTYRATVYKVTKAVEGDKTTKYNVTRVSSDSFSVDNTQKKVTFYHQTKTKDVEGIVFDHTASDEVNMPAIIDAISATMTFKLNGKDVTLTDGHTTYKSWLKKNNAEVECDLDIYDVDFKIQDDDKRAVINTVTFKIETPAVEGGYYLCKVKVNRSINVAE